MKFFQIIAKQLNLTVKYKVAFGHGSLLQNGSYPYGSAKHAITSGLADVGFCEFWVTPDLYHKVDMLRPWHKTCVRYLVPRPTQIRYLYAGLEAVPMMFWIILIMLIALTTPLVQIFASYQFGTVRGSGGVPWWHWCMELVSVVLTGMPSSRVKMTTDSSKILMASWSFLSVLFLAIYSSKLISHMNEPMLHAKIQTEKDMLQAGWIWSRYNIKMNRTEYIYPNQTDLIREWIGRHEFDKNMEDRVRKMKSRKYAVYGESINSIYYLPDSARPPANVSETYEAADDCIIAYSITIMMRKWSGFTPAFRKIFSRLSDSGIPEMLFSSVLLSPKMKRFIVSNAFKKAVTGVGRNKVTKVDSLSLDVMIGTFLILAIGASLASFVLVLELVNYRWSRRRYVSTFFYH